MHRIPFFSSFVDPEWIRNRLLKIVHDNDISAISFIPLWILVLLKNDCKGSVNKLGQQTPTSYYCQSPSPGWNV